jgi:hypothetical protein
MKVNEFQVKETKREESTLNISMKEVSSVYLERKCLMRQSSPVGLSFCPCFRHPALNRVQMKFVCDSLDMSA